MRGEACCRPSAHNDAVLRALCAGCMFLIGAIPPPFSGSPPPPLLCPYSSQTKFSAPDAADDEFLLSAMLAKLAKKNVSAWKTKMSAAEESDVTDADEMETNEYFMHRLNKTAIATTLTKAFNKVRREDVCVWGGYKIGRLFFFLTSRPSLPPISRRLPSGPTRPPCGRPRTRPCGARLRAQKRDV